MKYYSLEKIKKTKSRYNIIFGERSSGKTFACIDEIVKNYFDSDMKNQGAIIRRWRTDFTGKRGATYFDNLVCDGNGKNRIKEYSKGKYDHVVYWSGRWFMAYYDKELEKNVTAPEPFCYSFALTEMQHDKSSSFPNVITIVFDEFMVHGVGAYIPDEFSVYCNVLSTIIRNRSNVIIYMLANTVDLVGCIYWREMGLYRIKQMKPGQIDIYKYGDSGLKVAVEYTESPEDNTKPSDVYFAFNNKNLSKLSMITKGNWELDFYPHLLTKFERKNIIQSYFIMYENYTVQCDVVLKDNETFTFIHPKTTPIKHELNDIIFNTEANGLYNYMGKLTKPINKAVKKLYWYFIANKVFYSDNETGEVVARYLYWCNNIK